MKRTERMTLVDGSFTRTLKLVWMVARVGETVKEVRRSSISERPGGK